MKRARGRLPIGDPTPIVAPPNSVESARICAVSGMRPSPYCAAIETEWLPIDAQPRFCSWHHDGWADWPPEYRAWTPSAPVQKTARATTLRVVNPPDGATYLIDPTLRREFQTLRLRAASSHAVTWRVDEKRVPGCKWALAPGSHVISATDAEGNRHWVQIYVK